MAAESIEVTHFQFRIVKSTHTNEPLELTNYLYTVKMWCMRGALRLFSFRFEQTAHLVRFHINKCYNIVINTKPIGILSYCHITVNMKCQVITTTKPIYFNCILSYNEKQILFLRVSNYSLMITFQLLIRDLSTQTWLGLPSKQHQYIHVMNTSDIYNIHICSYTCMILCLKNKEMDKPKEHSAQWPLQIA